MGQQQNIITTEKQTSLNASEIDQIDQFLNRVDFKYLDLKIEMIDHIATGVEKFKAENPEFTTNRALYEYSSQLGHYFFSDIIKEKTNALKKYWRRKFLRYILGYFTLPKIIITLLIFGSLWMGFNFYGILFLKIAMIAAIPFAIIFYFLNRKLKLTDELEDSYMFIKQYDLMAGSLLTTSLHFNFFITYDYFLDAAVNNYYFGIVSCAIIALQIIVFYAVIIVFPEYLKEDVEIKYAHLDLKIAR